MDHLRLCVVVSSIGATDRLEACAAALQAIDDARLVVGFCDQSRDGSAARRFVAAYSGSFFEVRSARGLSAGRNAVIRAATDDVTHFAFPNDSSLLPPDFVSRILDGHPDADIVACAYEDRPGRQRYRFEPGVRPLDRSSCWKILEPAMVLSRSLLERAGLFDEGIGTGSSGVQSGEGTDLLLRVLQADPRQVAHWDPSIVVRGVPQEHGLGVVQRARKHYRYAVGYGFLLARWRYPVWFRVKALLAPLRFVVLRSPSMTPLDAVAVGLGRARGLRIPDVGPRGCR